ncbi:MAG: hydrolase, partial [Planctomycetales bacterium]|nr:hydrolase [Planctomycetales bacterium]
HAEFHRIALPPRHTIDDHGNELAVETGPALRWDFQPEQRRRVLLAIHYDTVFGAADPFQSCELLTVDRLQGPGVADAKGGIMVIRTALQALSHFMLAEDIGWTVLLTPDEELGSPSSKQLYEQIAPDFDFALLFEPALPTGELVAQRKGSGNYTLVVQGRTAHAGRHFEQGRNAVVELCRILIRIAELSGKRPGLTINVGNIQGGEAVNIVPDLALARLNVRVGDTSSAKWFEQQLKHFVSELNAMDGFRCRSLGELASPPKMVTDEMQQLMRAVEDASLDAGGRIVHWKETGGVCDGNKLAAAGLVNVDTLGPIGDGLHSRSEWVSLSSIVDKTQLVVNLLSRFSAGALSMLQRQRFETE